MPICFKQQSKPDWVVREIIRLKALMPEAGCRRIAMTFNRCHAGKPMRIGKSTVASIVLRHALEIARLRRKIRNRQPGIGPLNRVWALDMTGKTDESGRTHSLLGILDHGSRALLHMSALPNKCSWTLLGVLCLTIARHGKPKAVRTDNEACWTSKVFRWGLASLGIRHQRTELHCPWMNGRIERLFGTLKSKLDGLAVESGEALQSFLNGFAFWYNVLRPHQALNGLTPAEVWHRRNPFEQPIRKIAFMSLCEGLLTGFHIRC